ncbi:MAG: NAD(P)-dependent oxidoreductase [Clostridia bacterium]|nr:NAD(P)-dependent oxidoreductase [Clostridia bacterium]MBR2883889.1 NAD(P)-dependent oxidoreductase [Clostridia bacterium]
MWTEEKLNELLTTPSAALIEDMKKIKGDIMILGAGGKMGPTLCVLAKNAAKKAGVDKRIIAVSRGSDEIATKLMKDNGIEVIAMDLLDKEKLYSLPEVENVIYMAGKKFGTNGNEWQTWAMNSVLPAFVADKFKKSNIVVFSSGNIYPIVPVNGGGCSEKDRPLPNGEYAMSCLARERSFEYAAQTFGTKVFIYRLNFAVDLRYGVLFDVANKIMKGEPISLSTPCFNFIWQGSANEIALRGLLHATAPACVMNVTGPETVSIKKAAIELGQYLGKEPVFEGEEGDDAYLNDASLAMETFGYPSVSAKTLTRWQAEYILDGGRTLDKPTHFEERKGKY